jgi:hypothetical protein
VLSKKQGENGMSRIIESFLIFFEEHPVVKIIVGSVVYIVFINVVSNKISDVGDIAILAIASVLFVIFLLIPIKFRFEDKARKRLEAEPTTEPLRERYEGLIVSISRLYDSYLFNWDNISECDKEILRKFLKDDLDLGWLQNVEIPKPDANKTLRISKDGNTVEITINEKKEKATLKISDGRTLNLKIKKENGELKIYTATKDQVINKIKKLVKNPEDADGLRELYKVRGVGQTFRAIKHHLGRLKVCWLLCTDEVKEGTEVVEYFINEFGHGTVTVETVHLDSPNKIESVNSAIKEIYVNKVKKHRLEEKEVIADVTGGTAIMSSAITLACIPDTRDMEYVEQKTYTLMKINENIMKVVHSS